MKKWQGAAIALACVSALGLAGCSIGESQTEKTLKGEYDAAVADGYTGNYEQWLKAIIAGGQGPKGETGESAYDVAVENGFEGSYEEWVEGIKTQAGMLNDMFYEANKDVIITNAISNYFDSTNFKLEIKDPDGTMAMEIDGDTAMSSIAERTEYIKQTKEGFFSYKTKGNIKYKEEAQSTTFPTVPLYFLNSVLLGSGLPHSDEFELIDTLKSSEITVANSKLKIKVVDPADDSYCAILTIDCKSQTIIEASSIDKTNIGNNRIFSVEYGTAQIPDSFVESEYKTFEEIAKDALKNLLTSDFAITKGNVVNTFIGNDIEEKKDGEFTNHLDFEAGKWYMVSQSNEHVWTTIQDKVNVQATAKGRIIGTEILGFMNTVATNEVIDEITFKSNASGAENILEIVITVKENAEAEAKDITLELNINTNRIVGAKYTEELEEKTVTLAYDNLSFLDVDFSEFTELQN